MMKPRLLLPLTLLLMLMVPFAWGTETTQRIIFRSAMDAPVDDPGFQSYPQRYFELYTMNSDGSERLYVANMAISLKRALFFSRYFFTGFDTVNPFTGVPTITKS